MASFFLTYVLILTKPIENVTFKFISAHKIIKLTDQEEYNAKEDPIPENVLYIAILGKWR